MKSLIVTAAGLMTPARVTVTKSPAAMALLKIIMAVPFDSADPVATKCHPCGVSDTSTPVTAVKLVGPAVSLRVISPPTFAAVEALKVTVYVVEAPATVDPGDTVMLVTELPNVITLDVSVVPLPGCTVISLDSVEEVAGGLVPIAVILSVSPFERVSARVKVTLSPITVAASTGST